MPKPTVQTPPITDMGLTHGMQEGFELWKAGCEIWLEYLSSLPGLRTPDALIGANTKLWASMADICGLATTSLLKDEGLKAPTLDER